MKKILIILVVLLIAAAGYWWYSGRLAGAADAGDSTLPAVLAELGLEGYFPDVTSPTDEAGEGTISGSGSIEADQIAITSQLGGKIVAVLADEGDQVETGQLLVRLDQSDVLARQAQAEAGVNAARANLEEVRSGPRPEDVAAAEAELDRVIVSSKASREVWQEAERVAADPQEARLQLENLRDQLNIAEKDIELAGAELKEARIQYEEALRNQLNNEALVEQQVAGKQVEAAEVGVQIAQATYDGIQAQIDVLEEMVRFPVQLVVQANQAQSAYSVTVASINVARAGLAVTETGATPEEIEVAEASLQEAQAAVDKIDVYLDWLDLEAPQDGVILTRAANVGELASPGRVLMTLANLDRVELKVFVPESQIGRVREGQPARVYVDAYPNQVFEGTVSYIAPQAEFTPKNVQTKEERVNLVFAVKIRLENPDLRLKPGMPADAEILSDL